MKTDNYTDHVSKKKRQISEIRCSAPKKTDQKYSFKLPTRLQLFRACTATDKYHQEGQKHDRLPGNLQLRKPGSECCQCRGREGLKCFPEPATGGCRQGEGGPPAFHHTSLHSREATEKTYQNRRLSHFRFEAGRLPFYVAGCPLHSAVRALPISTDPRATSTSPSRAPRQGQGWHVPPAGPAPTRTHQQIAARPSPVARWMDSGGQCGTRAGQRGGSSSVTPEHGQAAAATATPQATAATTSASSSQQSGGTTATAPPKKKATDWPRRSRTSHSDWLLLPPRLRPPRRSSDWLTGQVRWRIRSEGAGRAWGRGLGWRTVARCPRVKPIWPVQVCGWCWVQCRERGKAVEMGENWVVPVPCAVTARQRSSVGGFWRGSTSLREGPETSSWIISLQVYRK